MSSSIFAIVLIVLDVQFLCLHHSGSHQQIYNNVLSSQSDVNSHLLTWIVHCDHYDITMKWWCYHAHPDVKVRLFFQACSSAGDRLSLECYVLFKYHILMSSSVCCSVIILRCSLHLSPPLWGSPIQPSLILELEYWMPGLCFGWEHIKVYRKYITYAAVNGKANIARTLSQPRICTINTS